MSSSHLRECLGYGYFLPRSKMADGRFILGFRRALLGSSLFQHVYHLIETGYRVRRVGTFGRERSLRTTVVALLLYWQHRSVPGKPYIFSVDPRWRTVNSSFFATRSSAGASKLATLRLLKEKGSESRCLEVASKSLRRIMMMLRGGTAPLMIESGRWRGLPREERRCRECQSGKIEDVPHWLLECHAWGTERQALLQCVRQVVNDFDNLEEDEKLVCVLDRGCKHASILKAIMKMWSARFY